MPRENPYQAAIRLLNYRNQQVVYRNVAVSESVVSDVPGLVKHVVNAWCEEHLALRNAKRRRRWNRFDEAQQVLAQSLHINAQVAKQ